MSAEYRWVKSSYSDDEGAMCVEVAVQPYTIHVRDSKNAAGPQLAISPRAWAAFVPFVASGA